MKTKRFRLLTVLLTVVMLVALSLNVMAAKSNAVTQDGLTAQLFTDKDSYKAGESVKASVQVDNHTGMEVFIFTEINVPAGVNLSSESTAFDALLRDGESWITPDGVLLTANSAATVGGSTATGDNMQAGFWVILTTLAVCSIIALFVYGKNKATWLSIMLCMAMVAGLTVAAVPVQAADTNGDIYLSCTIQMDGKDTELTAKVSYVIYDEAEKAADEETEAPTQAPQAPEETEAPTQAPEATETPTPTPEVTEETTPTPTVAPTEEPVAVVDTIYVSANAKAGEGDGTIDNPFADIEKAKALIREIKENDKYPEKGITVYFREGEYCFDETILFKEADSGEEGAPVVYSAYNDEKVSFVGGLDVELSKFEDVNDPEIVARLAKGAEDKIKQFDLAALGITNYGEMNVYGHSLIILNNWAKLNYPDKQPPELLFDGETMSIARWPNDGTVTIKSVVDKGNVVIDWFENWSDPKTLVESMWVPDPEGPTFTVNADVAARMANWGEADDIWAHGYWKETWSDQSLPIESFDAETGTIKAAIPSAYGTAAGRNFYFYNLLEEIDAAGEYYIDRTSGILYFYPPKESGAVSLSTLEDAMITLTEGAHDISFEGIELKSGLSHGVSMNGVEDINITNCEISLFADKGVSITNSRDVLITGSHLYDLGTGGVHITTSGEFSKNLIKTLESTNIVVENCEIHNFARITKTYSPAVYTGGVGTIVRNCKIYDAPCNAITLSGNDTLIENNEIFDVLKEEADKGVFYGGGAKETMGIVIRNNYIHDISSAAGSNIYVAYADDTKDGVTAESNLIVNVRGTGGFVNGGWDNNFRHNVLINCGATGTITAQGISKPRPAATEGLYETFRYVYQNYFDVYSAKYPHWNNKLEDLIKRNICKYNVIADNVVINVDKGIQTVDWEKNIVDEIYANNTLEDGDRYTLAEVGFANIDNKDYTIDENGSVCVKNSNFTIKEDSVIFDDIAGFKAYDLSKIGLIGGSLEIPGPLGGLNGEEIEEPGISITDDFSNLDNWTDASFDKTKNYTCGINSDKQLEIKLDAGRKNDVFLKYSDTIDNTKKLAFEFDLKVSGDVNSDFEAGFELKNGDKWAVTASFVKGKVKTQWSGTDTVVDDQFHKVKFVVDPETATVDVYVDGNVVKLGAAYLQGQTSWNTIQLFVKGNNSANPLTAYIDNFSITEVKPEQEEEGEVVTPPAGSLVFDDFSSLDNWVDISNDKTANYSCTINSDKQLEIKLDAGRKNDVFLKYNGSIDNTKKLAFEFDLKVSGDVSSDFEAGFELKNGAKWAVTTSFAKGKVKTQWSGTDTVVDDQVHKVKIVVNPETATVDVYVDGNVVKKDAAYLQSQTSWNTIQLFVKGNNSANTLTAYFDNFTVTEVTDTPDPVFDTVDANELVADEDGWTSTANATVEFKNGTVAVSGSGDKLNSYKDKTFKNTVFTFTYKQENTGSGWGGFGLILNPDQMPWSNNKCMLICLKEDKVEYQYWGTQHSGVVEKLGDYLKDGEEQEITFGMYDVDPATNKVAVVLSIDGQEIFNVVVEDDVMSGFEGYFTTVGGSGVTATLGEGVKEEEEEVVTPPVDALVFDDFSSLDNWTDISNDKTANYTTSNANKQLEIKLDAGRKNDVFLKYNGTIDNTKKLAFEFDLKVSGDVSSDFEAGFELKNGAKWAVTTSFAKGKVKTQWSGTDTVVDDQVHKVKIVVNPETATVDVYVDGNVVKKDAAYLQSQTSWNTIQLFVKGNNSANPLTAYFDNLKVTVEE